MTEIEIVDVVARAIGANGTGGANCWRSEAVAAIAALKECGFIQLERETMAKALFETAVYDTEVWPPGSDDRKALYLDDAEEIIKHLNAAAIRAMGESK